MQTDWVVAPAPSPTRGRRPSTATRPERARRFVRDDGLRKRGAPLVVARRAGRRCGCRDPVLSARTVPACGSRGRDDRDDPLVTWVGRWPGWGNRADCVGHRPLQRWWRRRPHPVSHRPSPPPAVPRLPDLRAQPRAARRRHRPGATRDGGHCCPAAVERRGTPGRRSCCRGTGRARHNGQGGRMAARRAPDAALRAVDHEVEALDLQASRFRQESELSRVNRSLGTVFLLSDGLADVLSRALNAARWTDGMVDPTVGNALGAARLRP